MPTWLIVAGNSLGGYFGAGATRYVPPIGALSTSGETNTQVIVRDSYTLAQLYVRVITNGTTAASTVRSRVNGANGNQSVSIPAGTTGAFEDVVNSDSLVDGDLFNTQVIVGGGEAMYLTVIGYTLSTVANTTPILCASPNINVSSGVTGYPSIAGMLDASPTETWAEYAFRVGATLSNFRTYVNLNTLDGASTARTRVNTANGSQSVSIGAGATGAFEDITNTDSISSGDTVNFQLVAGGTSGNISLGPFQVKSNSAGRQVAIGYSSGVDIDALLTRYMTIEGSYLSPTATEANAQSNALTSFTGRNMFARVIGNTLDSASTLNIRKNGANGNMSLTIPALTTGFFEDITNTDSFVASDLLNWQAVTGGSGAQEITPTLTGFELAQAAEPVVSFGLHPAVAMLSLGR